MKTDFVYDDGGRSKYFKGRGGDCVARAIAIASGRDYKEIYDRLAEGNKTQKQTKRMQKTGKGKKTALHGIYVKRKWFKDYMEELGFKWVPTMKVGIGCKVHLSKQELPKGRLVVSVSKHYTTMIDGVIHDVYDPRRTTIHYAPKDSEAIPKNLRDKLKPNEEGGVTWTSYRCVYGYWKLKEY